MKTMTKKKNWLGMLVMVLVFGMAVAACDTPKDELDGTTWKASMNLGESGTINYVLTFDSPNFTMKATSGGQTNTTSGTYTISGSTVTLTSTAGGETATIPATLSGNKLSFSGLTFTKQ